MLGRSWNWYTIHHFRFIRFEKATSYLKKFVKRIKNRYIVSEPDPAIPQQRSIQKSTDPVQFLNKASKVLQCDLEKIKKCARISESDKLNRDILLYWLWHEGRYTNLQIGKLFGLTYSSVSRRVTIIIKKVALEQNFKSQIEGIKSQIKPRPHFSLDRLGIAKPKLPVSTKRHRVFS